MPLDIQRDQVSSCKHSHTQVQAGQAGSAADDVQSVHLSEQNTRQRSSPADKSVESIGPFAAWPHQ